MEAWTAPELLLAPTPGPTRDPLALREAALARHPGMVADFVPLTIPAGQALRLRVSWAAGRAAPDWDELFIDPVSGRELGHRHWGDIGEGRVNLLPFIYRLHYTLLMGATGTLIMGLIALLWVVDCGVGLWLTLPPRAGAGWLMRWRPSWVVRWRAAPFRLTFDLHRAGGLWLWLALLVFALSSVSLNLPQVYGPAQRWLGGSDMQALYQRVPNTTAAPVLDIRAARARGMALAGAAQRRGPAWLWHVPASGLYVYGFTTGADIGDDGAGGRIGFDDRSGARVWQRLPGDAPAADRFTNWIVALHMADVFGWPWRVCVTLLGGVVAMLSVTGVLIWARKRRARVAGRRRITRAI